MFISKDCKEGISALSSREMEYEVAKDKEDNTFF
jgi:hypothetical protein